MTIPTAEDVKQRYPELTATTDGVINMAIGDAVPFFDQERWGSFFAQGFCAFVAHQVRRNENAAAGGGAVAGAIASKTVGDVSVSYQAAALLRAGDAYYATTHYGQRYLQLRRIVGLGAIAV